MSHVVPNVHATIRVSSYQSNGITHVIGPPIQFANGGFQVTLPVGSHIGTYEISGGFIPAMPNGLNGFDGLDRWLGSLEAQGLTVQRVD